MYQLVYSSHAAKNVGKDGLKNILRASHTNNPKLSLTGALYLKKNTFLQVLEGPRINLRHKLKQIEQDPRHESISVLLERDVNERSFGNWSMMLIGDDPETNRIQKWYWPDGGFDPLAIAGEKLLEFLKGTAGLTTERSQGSTR